MKTGWLILMGAALLALAGFSSRLLFWKTDSPACATCAADSSKAQDVLAWMKKDLSLSDAEFEKVCALHEAYEPQCAAMCARIAEAGGKLSSALVLSDGGLTLEADAALRDYEALRSECQRATLRHLAETAAVMKPETRHAFLQKVLPHLLATHQHVSEVTR